MLIPFCTNAQIINAYGGGGTTLGDGGPATSALINNPCQINFDKNENLYIASGAAYRVRKIDPSGIITTIAGTGIQGYSGDSGLATAAQLNFTEGIAMDIAGNIFISDNHYGAIRRIDAITGIITTICGNDTGGYFGDNGPATAAKLYGPCGICFDKVGNLYIADESNNVIRKIDTFGIITTVAGTGVFGYNGDNILAKSAQLYLPTDVQADDSGNIYIADQGNARVRKVDTAGIITTYAGNGVDTFIGDGMLATNAQFIPLFLKFDLMHNLYISDGSILGLRIYMVDHLSGIFHTVAGNGMSINEGDGGPATAASFSGYPAGIAFDSCGNLYIGNIASPPDSDRIRKVSFNPFCWPENVNTITPPVINIYPNPTTDFLNVDNVKTNTTYHLINITGIIEQSGTLKTGNNEIAVQALPTGIHLLQITDNEGAVTVHKIVKQ